LCTALWKLNTFCTQAVIKCAYEDRD
jgi:hypothetical protein